MGATVKLKAKRTTKGKAAVKREKKARVGLRFGKMENNAKLVKLIAKLGLKGKGYTFALPSGWTCPGALTCLSRSDRVDGTISDGPETTVRCYQASLEAVYQDLRDNSWVNFDLLIAAGRSGGAPAMAELILACLPADLAVLRIHTGGDLWSLAYLEAWLIVARARPKVVFYAYTKNFDILPERSSLPDNLSIVASEGSKFPLSMAVDKGYAVASIVLSQAEADERGLVIDHTDEHAIAADHNFALLIHGTQPAGTPAAAAWAAIKRERKAAKAAAAAQAVAA